jgi:hypothetical protein
MLSHRGGRWKQHWGYSRVGRDAALAAFEGAVWRSRASENGRTDGSPSSATSETTSRLENEKPVDKPILSHVTSHPLVCLFLFALARLCQPALHALDSIGSNVCRTVALLSLAYIPICPQQLTVLPQTLLQHSRLRQANARP